MAGIIDSCDAAPLVATRRGTSPSSKSSTGSFLHEHRKWIALVGVVASATSLYLYKVDSSILLGGDVECRQRASTPSAASNEGANVDDKEVDKEENPCPAICLAHRESYLNTNWMSDDEDNTNTHSTFDPMDIDQLIARVDTAHRQTIASLKKDYSDEYYAKLFVNDDPNFGNGSGGKSIGRYGFYGAGRAIALSRIKDDDEEGQKEKKTLEQGEMDDVSRKRYVRKMMMKVLKVQLSVTDDLSSVADLHAIGLIKEIKAPLLMKARPFAMLTDRTPWLIWTKRYHHFPSSHPSFSFAATAVFVFLNSSGAPKYVGGKGVYPVGYLQAYCLGFEA